jgi:hypothetical protein
MGPDAGSFGSGPAADPVQPCPRREPEYWIEIELNDDEGLPVADAAYKVKLPDGQIVEGFLDGQGRERLAGLQSGGQCEVTFPELDQAAWEKDPDPPAS